MCAGVMNAGANGEQTQRNSRLGRYSEPRCPGHFARHRFEVVRCLCFVLLVPFGNWRKL